MHSDLHSYRKFVRLSPELFGELVKRSAGLVIQKDKSKCQETLPAGMKKAITLRCLGTGESYKSLMYGFRVASNTIFLFVSEVCEAIYQLYKEELKCPSTPQDRVVLKCPLLAF